MNRVWRDKLESERTRETKTQIMAYKDQGGGGGGYGHRDAEATLRVEISDLGTVLKLTVSSLSWRPNKFFFIETDVTFFCLILKHNKEDGYDNGSSPGSHGSSGYGLRVAPSESDDDDEYSFGSLGVLPKGRPASLRDRISSVNSEVTIHDVRRCTITGPSSIFCR